LGVLNEVEPNLKKLPFDSEGIKLYVTFTKPRCICRVFEPLFYQGW